MRIAFYADNFYPELSGISDTIITTGKELEKRGHEIMYAGPRYAPKDYTLANRQYPAWAEDDTIDGMPVVRLPSLPLPYSPTGQSRIALPTGASFAAMQEFKPDLIHTQSPYGAGMEARRAARRLRVPLVGTNHTAIEDFFPAPIGAAMRRFDARYYNSCVFVNTPYQKLLERMGEAGFTRPGEAVPNPADLHEFTPPSSVERAERRRAFGLGEGPVMLYAGRLGVEKRVDTLVHTAALLAKQFPTITLVMTGGGAARPSLERLVKKLGIERHARFTGYLSRAALPHIYQAADIFCIASTSDSQSLALMQAYASGLPAVCARARGLPDYTPSQCGFLAEPNNPKDFADKMESLLAQEHLRQTMGAAGARFVQQFSPAIIAAEWEKIYSDALSQNRLRTERVNR